VANGATAVAGPKADVASAGAAGKDESGEGSGPPGEVDTGKRKPPTLLDPGENVEKVKAPNQPSQQPSK
jgi:hypothetical protein